VNSHVERIYEKLDVHSRTQAINVARRDRLIEV
jgi:DNA-binding NarL/FixJ family response regulator